MEGLDWDVADLYCLCNGVDVSSALGGEGGMGPEE